MDSQSTARHGFDRKFVASSSRLVVSSDSIDLFRYLRHVCHRGARSANLPENSLGALSLAAKLGCGAEIDLRLTADGKVVLFHDPSLKRAFGLDQAIQKVTFRDLRSFHYLGSREQVPLLSEALQRFPKLPLLLDVKSPDELAVANVVRDRSAYNRVIMIVRSLDVARLISRSHPDLKLCFEISSLRRFAPARKAGNSIRSYVRRILDLCYRFDAVSLSIPSLNHPLAYPVIRSSKLVFGYAARNAQEYDLCMRKNVIPVTSYCPARR